MSAGLNNSKIDEDTNGRKPSEFVGCISDKTAKKMISDINCSRLEWERNI